MSDSNPYNLFGGNPDSEKTRQKATLKAKEKEASAVAAMSRDMALVRKEMHSLDQRLASLERILFRSLEIQEKQLISTNFLLPEEKRPLRITDREVNARQLMGISIIGNLVEKELTYQFKAKAKKIHPDVNNGETTEEFLDLTEAYNYLIELASS